MDLDPIEVDAAARRGTRGRFCICAICPAGELDGPRRDGYRSLGYRLNTTKASGRRLMLPEHLAEDAPLRLYTAPDDGKPIGWVKSIAVGSSNWVSNVFVSPSYRRQGIGKSLMAKLLREDRAFGSDGSILTASHAGARLYDTVGYELLGHLLMFTPKRAKI